MGRLKRPRMQSGSESDFDLNVQSSGESESDESAVDFVSAGTKKQRLGSNKVKGKAKTNATSSSSSKGKGNAAMAAKKKQVAIETKKGAAPRKRAVTEQDAKAALAQQNALTAASEHGMVSRRPDPVSIEEAAPIPKALVKCNNTEIKVKKVTRPKYLFVLPGQLAVDQAGVCGTLENAGSETPVLNVEFSHMRKTLRLIGAVVSPANSYLLMQFNGNKKQVTCDSAYNDMVVFHSYQWLDEADNDQLSSQVRPISSLAIPASSQNKPVQDWTDPPLLGTTLASISLNPSLPQGVDDDGNEEKESKPAHAKASHSDFQDFSSDQAPERLSSQRSQRSQRATTKRRPKYSEVFEDSDIDDSDSGEEDESSLRKGMAATRPYVESVGSSNDDDDDFTL